MKQAHKIQVQKTAHYYTIGDANLETDYFWIACHGYGQSANTFIHKFEGLNNGKHFILAPEGLSRFYWNQEKHRTVGASWMTRMDRLDEIADYSNYLQQLYDQYSQQMKPDVKIILMGFSQGCATQIRWMMNKFPRVDRLLLWAGLLPEDLDYSPHQSYFEKLKMVGIYGNHDQFIDDKKLEWQEGFAKAQQLHIDTIMFEGKHVVDRSVLAELVNKF